MDRKLSHLDQYRMLREEIMQHMRELDRMELWGVTGFGAVYAWLITHKNDLHEYPATWCWWIAPCMVIFCAVRALTKTRRMESIAEYLRHLETNAFGREPADLPGWERHLYSVVGHYTILSPAVCAFVFWPLMIILSVVASGLFSGLFSR
jgi:hypothetical protein